MFLGFVVCQFRQLHQVIVPLINTLEALHDVKLLFIATTKIYVANLCTRPICLGFELKILFPNGI